MLLPLGCFWVWGFWVANPQPTNATRELWVEVGSWRSCLGARLGIFNAPREGPPTVDRVGTVAPVETGSATRVKVETGGPNLRKSV